MTSATASAEPSYPNSFRARHAIVIAILATAALCLPDANASLTTYSYVGNSFPILPGESSDYLYGHFTTESLAPNLVLADLTSAPYDLIDASLCDNLRGFCLNPPLPQLSLPDRVTNIFLISTGPSGEITAWDIGVELSGMHASEAIATCSFCASGGSDWVYINAGYGFGNEGSPGRWNASPEPSPVILTLCALLALAIEARKRTSAAYRPRESKNSY